MKPSCLQWSVVSGLGRNNFTSYGELKFLVTCHIFRSSPLPQKMHQSWKKMTYKPDSSVVFFLTLGWLLRKPQFWNQCAHFHISGCTPYLRMCRSCLEMSICGFRLEMSICGHAWTDNLCSCQDRILDMLYYTTTSGRCFLAMEDGEDSPAGPLRRMYLRSQVHK